MTDLLTRLREATAGEFTIEREIGRGGMGAVFLARDPALERPVAIKVLPPELARQQSFRERFLREARAAAGFSHPNVVPVHAVREAGDLLLFVMGYIDGESLAQRVHRAGPLPPAEAARLMQEVAWALAYGHGRGVIHRDIKPDNILLERGTGRALVTDFGIARSAAPGTGLTTIGEVVGTPEYMSPEQASGDSIDGRSDLYSLGATMHFALAGEPVFRGESVQATLAMHLTRPPAALAPRRPDAPAALIAAVEQCLAKDPGQRPPTGEALAETLDALRAAQPDVAPPIRVFYQRGASAVRITVIVALVTAVIVRALLPGSDADALFVLVLALAGIGGLWRGVFSAARSLLHRGFRFEDVRDGVRAILRERRAERDFALAARGARRRRRTRIVVQSAMIVAALLLWFAILAFVRQELAPGRYGVGVLGLIMLTASALLLATGAVGLLTEPTRISLNERLLSRLWSGPFGAWVFSLAAWRLRRLEVGSAGGTRGSMTPLDTFETLPKDLRSRLGGLRDAIERLEERAAELRARETELERAVREAGGGDTPTLPGGDGRRQELLSDLEHALEAERARGAKLHDSLENVRVHLIRLRSGVGTPEELREEIERAEVVAQR